MSKRNRFHAIGTEIEAKMDSLSEKCFRYADLAEMISLYRNEWDIPSGLTPRKFVDFLETDSFLSKVELKSEHYGQLVRYVWREPSSYSIAACIKSNSFFSHGSALDLHGLTNQTRPEIYVNHEQSPKSVIKGTLLQENVDRAFASSQRQSKLTYDYDGRRIVVINGKFTERVGVELIKDSLGSTHCVTGLERTLIDIAVRPAYAGGVHAVIDVYEKLRGKISIDELLQILKKMDYTYPYHQSIGFYMKQARYPENQLSRLRELGSNIDFYVDYQLGDDRKYDAEWRVFYPPLA